MSYEFMRKYEKTCPCGKGKILVTVEMDDWNRTREDETILCEECRMRERIKAEEDAKYFKLSNDVIAYFKEKYLVELLKYFDQIKTKKGIWQLMWELGMEAGSLQSFYKYFKMFGKQKYIGDKISVGNIPNLIQLINIKDEKLDQILKEPFEIYTKRKKTSKTESYNHMYRTYRKR